MLTIFNGRPSLSIDAGDVQTAITSQVAVPQSNNLHQERQDGQFIWTRDPVTGKKTGESPAPGPRVVRFSTSLPGFNINHFPQGWAFGNGVSLGVMVPLTPTISRMFSYCVFDDSLIGTVNANFTALQALMES